jgi:hypothetical protein
LRLKLRTSSFAVRNVDVPPRPADFTTFSFVMYSVDVQPCTAECTTSSLDLRNVDVPPCTFEALKDKLAKWDYRTAFGRNEELVQMIEGPNM